MAPQSDSTFVDRLSHQGEEALGKIAEGLIANPIVTGALSRAFGAREKAVQAQEAAMGALNLPSAADVERITRRLRSVSQRLEGIEDVLDRIEERAGEVRKQTGDSPSAALDAKLDELAHDVAALRKAVAPGAKPKPRRKSA
jgi:hypothetical protein